MMWWSRVFNREKTFPRGNCPPKAKGVLAVGGKTMRVLFIALILATLGGAAQASCLVQTGKCVSVPKSTYVAPFAPGDLLPKNKAEILLNVTYHGLPASDGTFWYARLDRHVYKVTPNTFEVIEDVTSMTRRLKR